MSSIVQTFGRAEAILTAILSDVQGIDWTRYGSKFTPVDPVSGVKRYQGFKVMLVPAGGWICINTFGDLPEPMLNERTVAAKIGVLRDQTQLCASIEARNPPYVWGGALRLPDGSCWGMSGPPEIADHILITLVVNYAYGNRMRAEIEHFLKFTFPGIKAATEEKGMSEAQYNKLVGDLEDMVLDAARKTR